MAGRPGGGGAAAGQRPGSGGAAAGRPPGVARTQAPLPTRAARGRPGVWFLSAEEGGLWGGSRSRKPPPRTGVDAPRVNRSRPAGRGEIASGAPAPPLRPPRRRTWAVSPGSLRVGCSGRGSFPCSVRHCGSLLWERRNEPAAASQTVPRPGRGAPGLVTGLPEAGGCHRGVHRSPPQLRAQCRPPPVPGVRLWPESGCGLCPAPCQSQVAYPRR